MKTASSLPCFRICSALFTLIGVLSLASLQAATWQGGDGDWVSDHWGLNSPDGSPGDANYPEEGAIINTPGTILIKADDSITTSGDVSLVAAADSEIHQTGGTLTSSKRIYVRTKYTLSGGMLDGDAEVRVMQGGLFRINGGSFSATAQAIEFIHGVGTMEISGESSVSANQVRANYPNTTHVIVRVIGSKIVMLDAKSLQFQNTAVDANVLADFVLDANGVTPWNITGGGNSLDLGSVNEGSAASLTVNVSARQGDGVAGVVLFDYTNFRADSTFDTISITDATYGTLTPGTQGELKPGQYFLNYGDYNGVGDTAIILYYNTLPKAGS